MPTEGTGFYSVIAPSVGWGEGKEGEDAKCGVAKGEIVPGTNRACDSGETGRRRKRWVRTSDR